ncbi:hypothetical protein DJ79_12325 [Halorubrum ezzemoulense]|uniref:Uncharacterized protein n=1 Tax=Halorubrum ezzemoulense TaxID=337243 RepID=A0A256JDV3_HALEZ|nr:hypothetical protein [Halorubrum ezzemoulense]OYR66497.1 hypothetical protein DJ79_12325 [Halorubrum ezzemoulense]
MAGLFTAIDSHRPIKSDNLGHLLIGEEHLDDGFTEFDAKSPISDRLIEEDSKFEAAIVDQNGYVKGEDPENPQEVVSSAAVRTPEPYNRDAVVDATTEVYDKFIRQYEQETPTEIEFDQDHTSHEEHTDWSYRMTRTVQIGDQRPLDQNLFKERFRIQFFEQTLLMTLVFGPDSITKPSVDEVVDELAAFQHEQYLKE